MPVGEDVTYEMGELFKGFLKEDYKDFVRNKSRATLRCIIISLYETAKVVYTLEYDVNKGRPNYKYVKQAMPDSDYVIRLETLRDNLTHNYHKVKDVILTVYDNLLLFGEEKLTLIAEKCGLPGSMYGDIMNFCEAYMQRVEGNAPVQSSLAELADMYKNF